VRLCRQNTVCVLKWFSHVLAVLVRCSILCCVCARGAVSISRLTDVGLLSHHRAVANPPSNCSTGKLVLFSSSCRSSMQNLVDKKCCYLVRFIISKRCCIRTCYFTGSSPPKNFWFGECLQFLKILFTKNTPDRNMEDCEDISRLSRPNPKK
jgi:hypothetical protein